jgi:hypothetical protein
VPEVVPEVVPLVLVLVLDCLLAAFAHRHRDKLTTS